MDPPKKTPLICFAAAVVLLAFGMPSAGAQESDPTWIVRMKPGQNPWQGPQMSSGYGGRAEHVYDHVLNGFSFRGSARAAEAMQRDPRVEKVEADAEVRIAAETIPAGIRRIRAAHATAPNAYSSGYRGAGVRIAIIDTGIQLNHPDLNVDASTGKNCRSSTASANDDNGHGTHVAGTAAALGGNGIGVIGAAPLTELVPVKVLSRTGSGTWSQVICGINHVTALAKSSNPAQRVQVANMSLGGSGSIGSSCTSSSLRKAICDSVAAGVLYTTAAGNSAKNTSGFVPANYPETIAVSALTDFDGEPGGSAGCKSYSFGTQCDDRFATFSNFGSVVDLIAPGVEVLSTARGSSYQVRHGTSMAAPHVAGAAALAKAVNPSLTPADIRAILKQTGQCPNAQTNGAAGNCVGKGAWTGDPDSFTEPLVNAYQAALAAAGAEPPPPANTAPTAAWNQPTNGQTVSGTVQLKVQASDLEDGTGTLDVRWRLNSGAWSAPMSFSGGFYVANWNTTTTTDGTKTLDARATDSDGASTTASIGVTVGNSAPPPLFVQNFEGGVSGWGANGLWHLVDNTPCASPGYSSATKALYFGRDATCTYNTGGRVSGLVRSPTVSGLPSQITLSFSHLRQVESSATSNDRTGVQVSYNGGSTWTTVWYKDARDPSSSTWETVDIPLNLPGSTLRVQWVFDSMNASNNDFAGWLVDDMVVQPR